MEVVYSAVEKGYTLAWGTDVSEKGFTRNGVGVLLNEQIEVRRRLRSGALGRQEPGENKAEAAAALPKEASVTQESRQEGFDNKTTTDDGGIQIFGLAKDQNGTNYLMIKNSWGTTSRVPRNLVLLRFIPSLQDH